MKPSLIEKKDHECYEELINAVLAKIIHTPTKVSKLLCGIRTFLERPVQFSTTGTADPLFF